MSDLPCPDCGGEGQQEVFDCPVGHPGHHPAWTHPARCLTCAGTGQVECDDESECDEEAA